VTPKFGKLTLRRKRSADDVKKSEQDLLIELTVGTWKSKLSSANPHVYAIRNVTQRRSSILEPNDQYRFCLVLGRVSLCNVFRAGT
jgi:hypothetical protein